MPATTRLHNAPCTVSGKVAGEAVSTWCTINDSVYSAYEAPDLMEYPGLQEELLVDHLYIVRERACVGCNLAHCQYYEASRSHPWLEAWKIHVVHTVPYVLDVMFQRLLAISLLNAFVFSKGKILYIELDLLDFVAF
ncbi:unnamed protein product [Thelazia callipaeda]|uniref:DDE Tnp4 domain-containing protein n=1 Tax=Thelazia callipaeda TaxID=103827 RepID=A0A0N5CT32_THECL|nr:unnamed protein product [Thelazia callipaeda]